MDVPDRTAPTRAAPRGSRGAPGCVPAPAAPGPARVALLIGAWVFSVAAGLGVVLVYANTPGAAGPAPAAWPESADLARRQEGPTLLLFAHPRCPCTRASLRELERLVAEVGGAVGGAVLFYRPESSEPGWADGASRSIAAAIPGFDVRDDVGGRLARRFGAATSGHVVVYDASGRLVFRGGITAARSHEGSNRGRDAIRYFVHQGHVLEPVTPVFGCPLLSPAETAGDACGECRP